MGQPRPACWNLVVMSISQRGQHTGFSGLRQRGEAILGKFTCVDHEAQAESKNLCHIVSGTGFYSNVGRTLVSMSGKGGSLEDALEAFHKMPCGNVVSWNTLIGSYVQFGTRDESFQVFAQMQIECVFFDKVTCVCMSKACASHSALPSGRRLHTLIVGSSFHADVVLRNALVSMYSKCGSLEDAQMTFVQMPERNVVSWNAMIAAYTSHGQGRAAFDCFEQMQEGVIADKVTFISILSACASEGLLSEGKQIHDLIVDRGFESDMAIQNALMNMYGKCGSLESARRMFNKILHGNVISWNAIILAYAHNGLGKDALQLFDQMNQGGMIPDRVTFLSILSACAVPTALTEGRRIHALIAGSNLELDIVVATALVSMYGKCGSIEDARRMFEEIHETNVVSWNAMIGAYAHNGQSKQALQLFHEMKREGVMPTKITFISILDACARHLDSMEGKKFHVFIEGSGLQLDMMVGNALMNMYGKCCNLKTALSLFGELPQRNDVSWNVMIATYVQTEHAKDAFKLFNQMQQEGVMPGKITFVAILEACATEADLTKGIYIHALIFGSTVKADVVVENALLNFYSKCGFMDMAWRMFDEMHERDVIPWTTLISGYALIGQYKEAFRLFDHMLLEGVIPNVVTVVSILSVCTSQAARVEGERMHASIMGFGFQTEIIVGNALINMYGKFGNLEDAQSIFDNMLKRDTVSWTAIIAAYSQHGQAKEALRLFHQMQHEEVRPNSITFLSVLSGCSHAGLLEEGYHWFVCMDSIYGITPAVDHFNCMIDLFGRAGRLDEAEKLVVRMPQQPTIVSLMAILGACKSQADVTRGERIAKHALKLDPDNSAPYVMLANIYAAVGRVKDAENLMSTYRLRCLNKQLFGNSMDTGAAVHDILVEEELHLQAEVAYSEL